MGFGFNLLVAFIIMPLSAILLILWVITGGKPIFLIPLKLIWGGILLLVVFATSLSATFGQRYLDKEDYYGEYIIDKRYFSRKQANWQYEHYRFEITEDDSLFFYVTDKGKTRETFKGTIETTSPYRSARLEISMEQPTHHVIAQNPIIYRSTWRFQLVFHSRHYDNMYFIKDDWRNKRSSVLWLLGVFILVAELYRRRTKLLLLLQTINVKTQPK